jgi:hypothetical protein
MNAPDFDDKDLVIVGLVIIGIASMFATQNPVELLEKIVIALGSLAVGKRL